MTIKTVLDINYVLLPFLTFSGIQLSIRIPTINSLKIPENSQTSSCRPRLQRSLTRSGGQAFAGPLSTPFRFRHVQPAMIRLLDLVALGPVRPSSLSLCDGLTFFIASCSFVLSIPSSPHCAFPARLSNRGSPMPGVGQRPDLLGPAHITTTTTCRDLVALLSPKEECPCGRANRRSYHTCAGDLTALQ